MNFIISFPEIAIPSPEIFFHTLLRATAQCLLHHQGFFKGGGKIKKSIEEGREKLVLNVIYPQIFKAAKNQRGDPWKSNFFVEGS